MFVLSKQEWFDKAVERAKLDPRRAYNADTGRCSYNRQGDVPGCFVGYACDADTLAILIDGSAGENVDNGHIGVSDFGSPWYGAAFLDSLQ
jgi:hypothetical protein